MGATRALTPRRLTLRHAQRTADRGGGGPPVADRVCISTHTGPILDRLKAGRVQERYRP